MTNGFVVHSDGTTTETATGFNSYSMIRAEDRDEALDLVKDHPYLGGFGGIALVAGASSVARRLSRYFVKPSY